ncbi:MAG: TonB-dependent receptor, partial [Rhodothermales bacterium]|nr:TonB-dependent receptor [Rhodothermales bacterium]
IPDVDFTDYWITNEDGATHLFPEQDRISFMALGEYTFSGEMNITPYFEVLYNKRETYADSLGATVGIEVPGTNPYNICNPDGFGQDCGLAFDAYTNDPGYTDDFQAQFGGFCLSIGLTIEQCRYSTFFGFVGPIGPSAIDAQVGIKGDRNFVESEVDQLRIVGGIRGDLPQISIGSLDNWSFDLSYVFSDGTGTSLRQGVNEERLLYSLETSRFSVPGDTSSPIICGDNDGCVPVNMFAPSLYERLLDNDFATQAERDYLFSSRTFDTTYKQTLASFLMSGDIAELPAGSLAAAFGYEFRNDDIDSIPNDVARDGLLYGFFRDLGAVGEKDTKEWFVEVEAPLLANATAFKELTLNVSTRHTDDEFYGGAYTYSTKLAWRPVDSLLIKGTVGTSYRAPNLRENFLLGTSGFLTLFDPCVTPEAALALGVGGLEYDRAEDPRSDIVLQNCINAGADPENLGISTTGATFPSYGVEILRGVGQQSLREEKSDSFTAGFAWDQPFFSSFDLTIGATYYEVDIRDEIVTLGSQSSINSCYNDAEFDSPFCDNIDRDADGFIDEVRQAFLNRDALQTRGVDINLSFDWPTQVFGRAVDFSSDITFNRKLEFSDRFIPLEGDPSVDSDLGEFGLPEWEGQGIFRADVGDYRFTWSTRYLSSVSADQDLLDAWPFDNYVEGGSNT